ncbi:MBOAT family O-acyltransferase [Clostridium intestinale]|uniref:MBOAT family O-acyltransferase n=1 Tax=Clostridium intestinale TaxID=36845 RepID=UPI002DD67EF4|nr:MBOAT family O-acyltransferase [Clostridium intestinale]WRY54012.1 MBOAT family O-acyltransferase [Clostridium intestinale]
MAILLNYIVGLLLDKYKNNIRTSKAILILGVIINLLSLFVFKYTNFFIENINRVFSLVGYNKLDLLKIVMPIGISYFTFQAISYIVDVYKGKAKVQKNILKFALYILFFPRLIAGPIIRYSDIEDQLDKRKITVDSIYLSLRRFIIGLGKKVIIANTLGGVADRIFAINQQDLTFSVSWLGIICYTLQIYFDFSGYSDMAIGLARLFGFSFKENFDYPYISKSITEFWRRWHISLSTWFKDYLYIPLGGNRVAKIRNYINLLIVFICTGIWHGASWNFIFWGLFHGFFIVFEKITNMKIARIKILNRIYTILVVMVGWVFFRSNSFEYALYYLKAMFGFGQGMSTVYYSDLYINNKIIFIIIIAVIGSNPNINNLLNRFDKLIKGRVLINIYTVLILFISIMLIITSTTQSFIYFRF